MFDIKGHVAQWRMVYEQLKVMRVGDVITYQEITDLLPDAAPGSWRGAFDRAVREMEDAHQRTFANVRTVGYRMVEAQQHETLARQRHKRAKRQLRGAQRKIDSVDRSQLTEAERRRFDRLSAHLAQQRDMIRRLDERQARQEARLGRTEVQVEGVGARVALTEKEQMALDDRVSHLEQLLRSRGLIDGPDAG